MIFVSLMYRCSTLLYRQEVLVYILKALHELKQKEELYYDKQRS